MNPKELVKKYRDVIPYLFFGVCTTAVNVIIYWIVAHPLNAGVMLSTLAAWFGAVLFAYVTNRKWVFRSTANTLKEILNEMVSFFICRLATGFVDWACMLIFVKQLHMDDMFIKFFANILVIVLNYIASKLVIFRKEDR